MDLIGRLSTVHNIIFENISRLPKGIPSRGRGDFLQDQVPGWFAPQGTYKVDYFRPHGVRQGKIAGFSS
jgi:hypothetical protein